ncbi:hypothetical protein CFC21_041289 [Triticum aestivum]|uniref:Uncharacterized protein n=3 Tax=Triticum aestivum TaxID=4565 RepID=A0A9R1EB33_WHEAT|nr:indole-3-acetic acid-amido synthetase GH3.8-like [Triticum aestivum]KAF7007188.1 hypothetical protein CFC21_022148 [Triticum aestivum]KAF7029588.1 hypothetical protein CFC21_041289 [Triticum aestivum]
MAAAATAGRRPASSTTASEAEAKDAENLRLIEEMTSNVDSVQERVLAEILSRNAATEYLTDCGGPTDRATFRAKVPVVSYDALKPYIQRIANGDRSPIMSTHPVSDFLTSSGTSGGERKLIPSTAEEGRRRQLPFGLLKAVMNLHFPGLDKGKGLYFLLVKSETKTLGGLTAWPMMTSIYKSEQFKDPLRDHTSPRAAVLCADTSQSMYAQMVCGLCQRHDVLRVGAAFASGLLRVIRFLQLNWEQLAADIEAGTLAPCVDDASVREAVAGILRRPDPELAQFVRGECCKGEWAGIVPRIWPNTRYIDAIVTGAMAQYVPALEYYGGRLPLVSSSYASSECYFGINLQPLCKPDDVSYTIMPNMAYFEFLPVDDATTGEVVAPEGDAARLVDLARVEAGREYEVVITTYAGLNRYRVGDVLRVAGYHSAAPRFTFVRRKNVLLSVESDKTDEVELQRAVERASELLRPHGASVAEYTSHACTKRIPGHYVIYWELLTTGDEAVGKETLDACCLQMEEALNAVYRQSRVADGSVGPLEIRVVRPGTFEELMDDAISRGASISQYKVPRCVALPPVVELLDSCVVSAHFSPSLPHWTPARRHD